MFRTQKATGLSVLTRYTPWAALKHYILTDRTDLIPPAAVSWLRAGELFVRPCPVVPAHGFVESRQLPAIDDPDAQRAALDAIWDEALAADPHAELLLTPYIPSAANAIWRPGVVSVGPGHDGATSGKDSVRIPAPLLTEPPTSLQRLLEAARITDTPYVEAVLPTKLLPHMHSGIAGTTYVVTQVRNGPGGDTFPDFIPDDTTVTSVVSPEGEDLLAWAARVKTFPPGTAVYHPGGNCNDHYFVHCRTQQVPIFTTRRPIVGEHLARLAPAPLETSACVRGLVAGLRVPLRKSPLIRKQAVAALTHVLHASSQCAGADAYWIGLAAMLMVRLGFAAALGEYRHSYRSLGLRTLTRDQVYLDVLDDYTGHRPLVEQAWASFHFGKWTGGYGGAAWATCTKATLDLEAALLACLTTSQPEAVNRVLDALNLTVNLAHNNGWWLNKFCSREVFDKAAHGWPDAVLTSSFFLYEAQRAGAKTPRTHTAWVRRLKALLPIQPHSPHPVPDPAVAQFSLSAATIRKYLDTPDARWRLITIDGDPCYVHLQVRPSLALNRQLLTPKQQTFLTGDQYLRINIMPVRHALSVSAGGTHGGAHVRNVHIPDAVFDALVADLTSCYTEADAIVSMAGSGVTYYPAGWMNWQLHNEHGAFGTFLYTLNGKVSASMLDFETLVTEWTAHMADLYLTQHQSSVPLIYTPEDVAIVRSRYGIDLAPGAYLNQQTAPPAATSSC